MLQVPLHSGFDGPRVAFLSEPTGHDELACADTEPWVASGLIARLLVERPGSSLTPSDAGRMSLCDRDWLVAALHRHCFGDSIESRVRCRACEKGFDLTFPLSGLIADAGQRSFEAHQRLVAAETGGVYTLNSGLSLRLPAVNDEEALYGAPRERAVELLYERCVVAAAGSGSGEALFAETEKALEALAPLLNIELPVRCAECGSDQNVDFDMVRFFLAALSRERALLVREVHVLATAYHWSHGEILSLPRGVRRAYVELVLGVRPAREYAA